MSLASEDYVRELGDELGAVGIGGGLRRRILAEIADHLWYDPQADLGDPRELALQFADELGSERARQAAYSSFAALAVAGVLFAATFLLASGPVYGALPAHTPWPTRLANIVGVFAPQLAFVAGSLALLRAWRRRHQAVLAAAEARIIRRRCAIALVTGLLSMGALALLAMELRHHMAGWWVDLAEVSAGVGVAALLSSARPLVGSIALAPRAPGESGDMFDDFGPLVPRPLRSRPWRLAVWLAGLVAVLITAAGVLQSDPFDGALRGLIDGTGCLLGFAVLGPFLGLWSPGRRRQRA